MGEILVYLPCKLNRIIKLVVKILKNDFISFLLIVTGRPLPFDFVKCLK